MGKKVKVGYIVWEKGVSGLYRMGKKCKWTTPYGKKCKLTNPGTLYLWPHAIQGMGKKCKLTKIMGLSETLAEDPGETVDLRIWHRYILRIKMGSFESKPWV